MSEKKIFSAFFVHKFSADLVFSILWLAASVTAIYIPVLNESPVRIILAIPSLLFIPGYCFIAALFPKEGEISLQERIMLSIGLSIAIVSLIGLGLNFTPFGIRLEPIVISLALFCWVMIIIGHYQRAILPQKDQFRISLNTIAGRTWRRFLPPGERRIDRFMSVILLVLFLIALISTVYVILIPKVGEHFTEFYILGENQTAADFPGLVTAGQNYPMYIGVGNHEHRDMTYTIETWMVHTESDPVTNTPRIIAMDPADYLSFTLADNTSTIIPYNLSVRKKEYNMVAFLLFNEMIPGLEINGSERFNVSYRNVYLWISVE